MKSNFAEQITEEVISPESYVFKNPVAQHTPSEHMGIEKISLNDDFTRIDFVYIAPKKYINGGWIQIDPQCFIRPIGNQTRYKMVQAINIPIAPAKYHFQSKGQVHHFTLLFPPLPKSVKQIDVIEKLAEGTFFNFFSVALQHNAPTLIRIINEN
jgi:hypothetical protein